ncbi:MAG: M20 family metallo-hydrolase, partial [candidate division KSB1 bacterium]|nr:M20 family metallo-hydrolase [candidate division KSB1 bacterium]
KLYLAELRADEFEEVNCPDDRVPAGYRPNLVARIRGKDPSRTVWIMSHLDVVPPGERALWDSDPFELRVEDGKLFGRGVEDNQQGIVSSYFAAKALRDLGIEPAYNVGLVLVADEETGSRRGLHYVLEKRGTLFQPQDLIIVPDAGDPDGTMIEVAEKSILWLRFRTLGKQCHASTPEEGRNAFKAACYLAVRLQELYQAFPDRHELFSPPISTFEPTKKEANVPNVNTIPGEDVFYYDCRVLPKYRLEEVEELIAKHVARVEEEFGVKIEVSSPQRLQAAPATPADAPVVRALQQAIRDLRGKEARPKGIGGGTVAAHFRLRGLPAAVWATLNGAAHQPNEFCLLDNLVADAQVFAHVFVAGN